MKITIYGCRTSQRGCLAEGSTELHGSCDSWLRESAARVLSPRVRRRCRAVVPTHAETERESICFQLGYNVAEFLPQVLLSKSLVRL